MEVDLDLIFENFVKAYRSFGLSRECSWARHTTEYLSWFAQEGMQMGFHVDQEVRYDEPEEINAASFRFADMVWVTYRDGNPDNKDFIMHLESETKEENWEITLDLLAYSPFKPLPVTVAILHRRTYSTSKRDFISEILAHAIKIFKGIDRALLLMLDMVYVPGDPFHGYILEPGKKWRPRVAKGMTYEWQGGTYFDLRLEK